MAETGIELPVVPPSLEPTKVPSKVKSLGEVTTAATKTRVKKQVLHPPVSEMVCTAIKELGERRGSSLQGIKGYIFATYNVNNNRIAPHIKTFIKKGVESGKLLQKSGTGATGRFRLAKEPKTKKAPAKKEKVPKKTVAKKDVKKSNPKIQKGGAKTAKASASKKKVSKKPTKASSKTAGRRKPVTKGTRSKLGTGKKANLSPRQLKKAKTEKLSRQVANVKKATVAFKKANNKLATAKKSAAK